MYKYVKNLINKEEKKELEEFKKELIEDNNIEILYGENYNKEELVKRKKLINIVNLKKIIEIILIINNYNNINKDLIEEINNYIKEKY